MDIFRISKCSKMKSPDGFVKRNYRDKVIISIIKIKTINNNEKIKELYYYFGILSERSELMCFCVSDFVVAIVVGYKNS